MDKNSRSKSFAVAIAGTLSFFYILNPAAGIFELIPDVLPVIGNLDEATAVAILLSALSYFGIKVPDLFGKLVQDADKKGM